ncbi:MAG: type IV pilus assembly protein PilM [Deltaproteobacteria bacterium]|nr:type IV pilus assembly protein PilM [Deltaproteobacteria bacterium]
MGIGLGSHTIKMVETISRAGKVELLSYGVKEIPLSDKTRTQRDISVVAELVGELLGQCIFPSPDIYFSISGPAVYFNWIDLPRMPEKEVLPAIMWECRKTAPFPLESARIMYQKDGLSFNADGKDRYLIAAAQNELITSELEIFKRLQVNPAGIDLSENAILAACRHARISTDGQNIGFFDIGAEHSILTIIKDNEIRFSRQVAGGGNDFTQALLEPFTYDGRQFEFMFDEADHIKKSCPVYAQDEQTQLTEQGIPYSTIKFMLRPVLEKLMTEANRSVDFYKARNRESGIDRLYLYGGGASLKNIAEAISKSLGVETVLFDPFARFSIPPHLSEQTSAMDNRHQFTVAAGLSIGRARDMNFMHLDPGMLESTSLRTWVPAMAIVLGIFMLFTMYARQGRLIGQYEASLKETRTHLDSISSTSMKMAAIENQKQQLLTRLKQYPQFDFKQPSYSNIFVVLFNALPRGLTLTRIVKLQEAASAAQGPGVVPVRLQIEGTVTGQGYRIFNLLNRTIDELEKSPYFVGVSLESTEKSLEQGRPVTRFELICSLGLSSLI